MVLNLKESILSNTLVLLSPLIYHGLLISNLSALKLVKPLEPSTVTSISMLLLILFLLCIALLSFPIFFYCSSVCDPPVSSTTAEILEKTQHIVLKMCSHKWENDYSFLISMFNLPILSICRSISKLCLVYKITNNLLYFPSDIFIHKPLASYATPHFDPLTFTIPFCHSSASQTHLSLLFSLCGIHFLII